MTVQSKTLADLAGEAYSWLERRIRDDGESYVTLRDGAPEWIHDLVYDAHGDFLPEDWRYKTIRSALSAIHDASAESEADTDDLSHEFADGNVDTYNADRYKWLASNLQRAGYCEQGAEDLGFTGGDVNQLIGLGQYVESEEVFESVVGSLQVRLDEIAEEEAIS